MLLRSILTWLAFSFLCAPLAAQDAPETAPLSDAQEPSWKKLNEHVGAPWFRDAKFGVFIHWGVYSVPSFCDTSTYSEWYWHWYDTSSHGGKVREFHDRVYGEDFPYTDFAKHFGCELFDPVQWADILQRSGARYVVLTAKHHDGFALWPSAEASKARGYPWNSVETGPRRDLVGELGTAVKQAGLKWGLYYSFLEWHNPLFDEYVPRYVDEVMFPQVKELITRYELDLFWPDGEWGHPDSSWRAMDLLTWIYEQRPGIVVNDRWGKGLRAKCGDFFTTEYGHGGEGAESLSKPFEECRGIGGSFAFNRAESYEHYMSRTECVRELIDIVSRGGNLLLDIGPDADGTIPLIMVDRLLAMGRWLDVNGESIHGTTTSGFARTPWGRATQNGNTLYLHVYEWPKDFRLRVPGLATAIGKATLLHDAEGGPLPTTFDDGSPTIDLSGRLPFEHASVIELEMQPKFVFDPSVFPLDDGTLVLEAKDGVVFGSNLRIEKSSDDGAFTDGAGRVHRLEAKNLGYWTRPNSGIAWPSVVLDGETAYEVELVLAVKEGSQGSLLEMRLGTSTLKVQLAQPTGPGWHDYVVHPLGTYGVGVDGRGSVALKLQELSADAALNLRAIVLRPTPR